MWIFSIQISQTNWKNYLFFFKIISLHIFFQYTGSLGWDIELKILWKRNCVIEIKNKWSKTPDYTKIWINPYKAFCAAQKWSFDWPWSLWSFDLSFLSLKFAFSSTAIITIWAGTSCRKIYKNAPALIF